MHYNTLLLVKLSVTFGQQGSAFLFLVQHRGIGLIHMLQTSLDVCNPSIGQPGQFNNRLLIHALHTSLGGI